MQNHHFKRKALSVLAAAVAVSFAGNASAWQSPSQKKYLTAPLSICDQGVFYVGGAPKVTRYGSSSTPSATPVQIIIGAMYVEFQRPNNSKKWPTIIIHGSGYSGTCVDSTAAGTEGWRDYLVRKGISTYVADQSGRARSSWDKSIINEGRALLSDTDTTNDAAGRALLPAFGGSTSDAWTSWFGHFVGAAPTGIKTSQMVRHGANGVNAPGNDPLCTTQPAHCNQLGRIVMEPELPQGVDQCIKARSAGNHGPGSLVGECAVQGLGTTIPDDAGGHVNDAFPLNDMYVALDAYKFNYPNTEGSLPGSVDTVCCGTPVNKGSLDTWTPRAAVELIEGLGGAVVGTHSQSGVIGHDIARILHNHGKLNLLKGMIQIEGSCSFANTGTTPAMLAATGVAYLAFKGDYSATSAQCQQAADDVKNAGGQGEYVQMDQPGFWQGAYPGPYGNDYVGPHAGVSHMMMFERTALDQIAIMAKWADMHIPNPALGRNDLCGNAFLP